MTIEDILDEIFSLVYHSHFDFNTVWQMPVTYKRYLILKLIDVKEKEQKEIQREINKSKGK